MMMNVLAISLINPWLAVAGAGLMALPVVIHWFNRRRFTVMPWAAMDYLLAAMHQNRRRLKFEQWLLLIVRCCVLGLLGLALARPLGCGGGVAGSIGQRTGLQVLIIDNSYSMAYEANRPSARTHLDQAKLIARRLIDQLSGQEAVVVITAAAPSQAIIRIPTYDRQAARLAIDRIGQSYGNTDLAGALRLAKTIADESSLPRRDLHLITDATRSALMGRQASELPALAQKLASEFSLVLHNVSVAGQWNQAVLELQPATNVLTTRQECDFWAVIKGFATEKQASAQWKLDGQILGASASNGDDSAASAQWRKILIHEPGVHMVEVTIDPLDPLKLDDTRRCVVSVDSQLKTLIVQGYNQGNQSGERLDGSAGFLQLALAPPAPVDREGSRRSISEFQTELINDLQLGNQVLSDYRAVVLVNVAQLPPTIADQLQRYVRSGGALMIVMGDQVQMQAYNQVLWPRQLMPGKLVQQMNADGGRPAFRFDFDAAHITSHFLKVFANQPASGLETAQIYSYLKLDLPENSPVERVLNFRAKQASDDQMTHVVDPAITAHQLGQGQVIVLATSVDARWSTLPAKPAYVVLMHELLKGSIKSEDGWMNLEAGQQLTVPRRIAVTAEPQLLDGAGGQIALTATADDAAIAFISDPIRQPGIYQLDTGANKRAIAVNVSPDEADVRSLDASAIRSALGDAEMRILGDTIESPLLAQQEQRDYGRVILVVVLLVAGLESYLAMRFGYGRR